MGVDALTFCKPKRGMTDEGVWVWIARGLCPLAMTEGVDRRGVRLGDVGCVTRGCGENRERGLKTRGFKGLIKGKY